MNLGGYVLRRLLQPVPIALGVTILVFFLIHLVPGDPARDDPRQPGDAGARRPAPPRVGARPPAPGPVREVHGAARARRPRRLALLRRLRRSPRAAAAAGHALADRLRDAALGADRRAVGGDRRDPPRPHPRPRRPRGAARRPRLPALLGRDRAAARLRAAPRARCSRSAATATGSSATCTRCSCRR